MQGSALANAMVSALGKGAEGTAAFSQEAMGVCLRYAGIVGKRMYS